MISDRVIGGRPVKGGVLWQPRGMKLTAVFEPAREGGYTCFVEEVPAAISQGETLDEAKANLLDAPKLVLECQRELAEKNLSPTGKANSGRGDEPTVAPGDAPATAPTAARWACESCGDAAPPAGDSSRSR